MVNTSLDKLSTEEAETYLVWTEIFWSFGKNDNVTINTWLTLDVTWGAFKRFCRRCLLSQFSIFSSVVWHVDRKHLTRFQS